MQLGLLLLVLLLALTGSSLASKLRVELAAPWHSSVEFETASFVYKSNQTRFWDALSSRQLLLLNANSKYLDLALRSGQYAGLVQTHLGLSSALRSALEVGGGDNWAAYDSSTGGGVRVFTGEKEEGEECAAAAAVSSKLAVYPLTDFILPANSSTTSPTSSLVCVVHGDLHSDAFFRVLHWAKKTLASTHAIVVRMSMNTTTSTPAPQRLLGGFSVSLDIKNTEYVQQSAGTSTHKDRRESGVDFVRLLERFPAQKDSLAHLERALQQFRERSNKPWHVADVSVQIAMHVMQQQGHHLSSLQRVVENLPAHVQQLAEQRVPGEVYDRVSSAAVPVATELRYNDRVISPQASLTDIISLLREEDDLAEAVKSVGASLQDIKQWMVTTGDESDRVDVRRLAKGAVVFLNDVEKDQVYRQHLPSTGFSHQFKSFASALSAPQQLIPVRRNLYTAILTLDPLNKKHVAEWLGVFRHFVRMGAPIRFGVVLSSSSSTEGEMGRCVGRLFYAAKREFGLEAALDFVTSVASAGSASTTCAALEQPFVQAMAQSTRSWRTSQFSAVFQQATAQQDTQDGDSQWDKAARYVRELNLPTPSLTFNGLLVEDLSSSGQFRLDRALQQLLFAEQAVYLARHAEFDEKEDLLAQLLAKTGAQPRVSRLRTTRGRYWDVARAAKAASSSSKSTARVTVLLSKRQREATHAHSSQEEEDVRYGELEEEEGDGRVLAVVNARVVALPDVLTSSELAELVQQERHRVRGVPLGKTADDIVLCSAVFARLAATASSSPASSTPFVASRADFAVEEKPACAAEGGVVRLTCNPLDANTPRLVAVAAWIQREFPCTTVQLRITPELDVAQLPPASFHRWSGPDAHVTFDTQHDNVPASQLLTLKMQANSNWLVFPNLQGEKDPDNLMLSEEETTTAQYQVAHVLVDGHSYDHDTGEPSAGLQLELVQLSGLQQQDNRVVSDSIVMYNLGYWQTKASLPGVYAVRPKLNHPQAFAPRVVALDAFAGPGPVELKSSSSSSSDDDATAPATTTTDSDSTLHVFSLASGALYERFLRIMMLSVRKRSSGKVKFWLLENYMSRDMKLFLPGFALKHQFEYQLVTFKWPDWLRGQSERQRQIWGMKILFLDVLFPLSLERVIYVDADQVLRADLRELWTLDLHGAPYAMTPFCDSRQETLGFQFWRQGFWAQHLRGKHYHISALFVVDLKVFRQQSVGDRLRAIYQQLSADPGSLSNLDQDLPNFAQQHDIAIHSLPQEWLWCESWCSDASLARAKTIDLCNNPLRKEPKLDMAKRVIKGPPLFQESWEELDEEVGWGK